ncbi:DUF1801 domain-containing protein [Tropicimonas marinistellae]|uniref:DUF1801 domain-containing protein n=1 Tax=Tropicimonas marinistellae TaxID=1739787 RepID=UPI00082AAE3E|nr:DUF1801 domain-containing protein [Tropicimonas marinistellae]
MADVKTVPTDVSAEAYVAAVEPASRRADATELLSLFQRVTGFRPVMWGPSIIGFGRYDYRYESGRTGSSLATGFAPRKANLVIYIMPGYADFEPLLARLGKHRKGRSCLYINKLADIDTGVLEELILAGLADLGKKWPVQPS